MTPEELRAEAEALERAGRAALDAGDALGGAQALHRARVRRLAADEMERLARGRVKGLHTRERSRSEVSAMMTDETRLAISKGHPAAPNELKRIAHAAGYSLAGLARAVKAKGLPCSSALLTMAWEGTRPMPQATAEAIQKLTRSKECPGGLPVSRWRHLS